jgi:glycerol-3-phosphate dehydrogenase (NAD(P)+)
MNNLNTQIGVVGAGSWGTALADLLARKRYTVDLWCYEPEVIKQIEKGRENRMYLPGFTLSDRLHPSGDLAAVVSGKDLVLVVVPSHVMRGVAGQFAGQIGPETIVVSASKGIENNSHLTMSAVIMAVVPTLSEERVAVLSGPSFAKEVATDVPTAVSVAAKRLETAERVQKVFSTAAFRVYTNADVVGVELGGAVKNVIAIAAGVIDGLGLGLNTRAALITRGQTEIRRLGVKMGANPRTFTGLAGIGDLVLTCTGTLSRNHTVGMKIGQGQRLEAVLAQMHMVAEGVRTAKSVYNLSRKLGVEMPICHAIYRVLYENLPPGKALAELMSRDLRYELDEE